MNGFEAFFAREFDPVVRSLTVAVGDRARAEEAAQEAFARALRKWSSVSAMQRPVGWVYVVAMNHMRRWFRREARARELARPTPTASADLSTAVIARVAVRAGVDALPPRQRAAVVLRYLCDLSLAEVAQAMGCSVGTVKSTLHAALSRLRVDLEEVTGAP